MKLSDVLDLVELQEEMNQGYVGKQVHPTEPLVILNYTHKAQYDNRWNAITTVCRGLVYNSETKEIVARPFTKFYNYSQPGAPVMPLDAKVSVAEKMDGSLGILVPLPSGGHCIATRGSFTSEQAKHATKVWAERYAPYWEPLLGTTYLFEIVYPGNRIVLDYGDLDDVVCLASIDVGTGKDTLDFLSWPGIVRESFSYRTLEEALHASPRPNAEGYVVYFPENGQRIKLKQADYVALHRIMTTMTPRIIWEYMAVNAYQDQIPANKPKMWESRLGIFADRAAQILAVGSDWQLKLLEKVPDEFYEWFRATGLRIAQEYDQLMAEVGAEFDRIMRSPEGSSMDQGTFARYAKASKHAGEMFALRNGQDIRANIWKAIYPPASGPWMNTDEATS